MGSTVVAACIDLAGRIAARLASPRVRALHLPPPARVKKAEFCALELDDGSVGFAYVLLDDAERALRAHESGQAFCGRDALALARGYASHEPAARAIGFAAVNALSQSLFRRSGWLPPGAGDSLGDIDPQPGEHIGMIGLFPSLVSRVHQAGARLTTLELKPDLAGEFTKFRITLDPRELDSCDKVVSTCTVMLNDTLDAVLDACRNARRFAIIGPTAGCVPDPLFARGVHTVAGRGVVDLDGFREAFRRGEKWGSFARKYAISVPGYPGVDDLLERTR